MVRKRLQLTIFLATVVSASTIQSQLWTYAIVDSMLEEEDTLEPDHKDSANNHLCAGADNTMEQFVNPFLLVPQETEATWDKRDLSTGCFSNPLPKKYFRNIHL